MFKEAAKEMRVYFEILERGWMDTKREGKWFLGLDRLHVQLMEWPHNVRDKAREQLDIAYGTAWNDTTRERIEYVRQGNRLAYLLSKTLEDIHTIEKSRVDLETGLRNILDRVKETITLYHEKIEPDETLGAAYYRGERADRQLAWWKGYIGSIISDIFADSDALRKLFAEDETYQEMVAARKLPRVEQRIKESREARR